VDPDTTFEIGSISKVFTSLLLADAVGRGEVALTDSCADHLPAEVHLPGTIRLWHLATHSSGLPRDASGFSPGPYDSWYERYTIGDLYRFLNQTPLSFEPGSRWSYSNLGANLLGHILSLRTGMTYEELLRSRVLEPLEMTSTYVYQEPPGVKLATPYARSDQETDYFMVPVGLEGAGRIRSTARDMGRFVEAALGLRSTSLDPAFALSEALHFIGDEASGAEVEQGLGWGRGHAGGSVFVGHGGGTWGFTSSMNLDRDRRYGTIILTNSRHARDCLPGYLSYWLTTWQKSVVLDAQTRSDYPGEYALPSGTARISLDGSHLFALLPGEASQRIHPEGNDRFFSLSRDVELRFERDTGGHVSGLVTRTSADPGFPD
jgi:CubicO group peptidase (beta-lactamase class C family)